MHLLNIIIMTDNKSVSHIPVLTGSTNYRSWWIKVDSYTDLHSFSATYEGKNDPADPTNPTLVETASQCELKAKGLLKLKISDIIAQELYNQKATLDTTQKMLAHLKDKYEKQGAIASLLDFTQLFEWWSTDNGNLEGQLGWFYDIQSRCAVTGLKLEDYTFTLMILTKLPEGYAVVKDSMLTNIASIGKLELSQVHTKVIETEFSWKSENSSSANAVTSSSTSSSHANTNRKGKNKKSKPPPDKPCYWCQRTGHWASKCWSRPSDKGKKNAGSSSLNVVDNSDAQSDSSIVAYLGAPKNFLIDSGTTDHMTPFRSNFKRNSYISLVDSNQSVTLGDSTTQLRTLGKGTIEQWVETRPHQHHLLVLVDILHVEGIKQHFLLTSWLLEKGFSVNFTKAKVKATKGDFTIKGFRTGHIFQCPLYTDKPRGFHSLNSIESLSIKTLHKRMGHLNWDALKQIWNNSTTVIGVRLNSLQPPKATDAGCAASKAKCCAFKSSTLESQATEPLEHIHSDLTGPMEPNSIRGHCFICAFTCDCTHHVVAHEEWIFIILIEEQQ